MFIERVEGSGFGGLHRFDLHLERATRLDGNPRALLAVQDALLLVFGAFDAAALRALLERWGCENPTIEGEPLPEGAHWTGGAGIGAVLDRGAEGVATVGLTITLDPPQFGTLRRLAARDTRLVDALAEGARLHVRVGARFSTGLDAVALDPLTFIIGAESFPVAGAERPKWMTAFLRGLGGRLHRGPVPGALWGVRAASYDAEHQHSLRRALAALGGPPAALGDLVALPDGPAKLEADALVPVRHLGAEAAEAAGLVGAVFLSGAEVLVVDRPPAAWDTWLAEQAEAEGSPLEQVLLFGVPGGVSVG